MIKTMMDEDHIVITGGLTGIGLETLKILNQVNPNSKIIITSREYRSGVLKLKKIFPENTNIKLIELDLEQDKSVDDFLKEIKITCKKIFSLILNAGFIETSPSLMTTHKSIEKHLAINYTNNIRIVQFIVRKYMLKQKRGSGVNITYSVDDKESEFETSNRLNVAHACQWQQY